MYMSRQMAFSKIIKGLSVPLRYDENHIDKLASMQLYEDDVWIVGYPKSGTHWASHIVRLIHNGGVQDDKKIKDAVPWLDAVPVADPSDNMNPHCTEISSNPEAMVRPRAFKSHFTYSTLPYGPPNTTPCKYIYIARNPMDAFVSFYSVVTKVFNPNAQWDTMLGNFMEGKLYFGDYFDHVLDWWEHRGDSNVFFVKYEDLKKNPKEGVSKIANFIGKSLPEDTIDKIVELVAFDSMKKDETVNYSWDKHYDQDGEPTFLRKGVVGDWKNVFTAEQSAAIVALCAARLSPAGLEFDFE